MIAKTLSVGRKPYLKNVSMERIKRVIAEYGLALRTEGEEGQEKLVFENDPQRRWLILKLLDDDYLYSEMTDARYAANSRAQLAVMDRHWSTRSHRLSSFNAHSQHRQACWPGLQQVMFLQASRLLEQAHSRPTSQSSAMDCGSASSRASLRTDLREAGDMYRGLTHVPAHLTIESCTCNTRL